MNTLEIIFWIMLGTVVYVYIGYPILLRFLVLLKEIIRPPQKLDLPEELPTVTLFITAFNQEEAIESKMRNSLEINYPKDLLTIMWVTDGSTDNTNYLVGQYPEAKLEHIPEYKGKCASMNRAIQLVDSDITIFSEAGTVLNSEAVNEIVKQFSRSNVGCVIGEKRIDAVGDNRGMAVDGEGFYWRYESIIKDWGARLYSGVGASGELYAIRTQLYRPLLLDTMLDDMSMTIKIAMEGQVTAYTPKAYAIQEVSANLREVQNRAVRLTAGGLQAFSRLRKVLNPMNHGVLFFEYMSHRVLRWTIVPMLVMLLLPINIALVAINPSTVYITILVLQVGFNVAALMGHRMDQMGVKNRFLRLPYFFWFMNLNVFRGYAYLRQRRVSAMWKRTKRAYF